MTCSRQAYLACTCSAQQPATGMRCSRDRNVDTQEGHMTGDGGVRLTHARRPAAWLTFLIAGAVTSVAIELLPWPYEDLLWAAASVLCVAVFLVGPARVGRRLPVPWRVVAAGFAMRLLADLAWTVE